MCDVAEQAANPSLEYQPKNRARINLVLVFYLTAHAVPDPHILCRRQTLQQVLVSTMIIVFTYMHACMHALYQPERPAVPYANPWV